MNILKERDRQDQWRTLPEICMELHMCHTGASDSVTDSEYNEAIEYLNQRVSSWKPMANGRQYVLFDAQVLGLCIITLEEASNIGPAWRRNVAKVQET